MDVQTGLVYVGVVLMSAAVILLVSMFGIKEKSYEEAIAEQRKLPDYLLFGKRDKNKEKKHKNKSGKKVKEKKEERDDTDEKEEKSDHVQFEENPQILPHEPPVQEGNKGNKKKGKLEKVKPILVNKDEPLMFMNDLTPSQPLLAEANHFEIIHPKDDLELIRSHSRENLQGNASEPVVNKSPKETPTKSKKYLNKIQKKEDIVREEKKETTNLSVDHKESTKDVKEQQKDVLLKEVKETTKEAVSPVQSSSKESKKNKKKNDILAQISGDKDGVDISLLELLIQKAELSRSEIQTLIDQLFNKQLDNPLEHSEWTEGRADPVIKLKKQLAEREKAFIDEHEANIAFQGKLRDLRLELNNEKSRLNGHIRHLEDILNSKVTELQTSHTRMKHILESHAAEKQGFSRQIEQLQSKINEDAAVIHKMQEEQGQTKGHLQQELISQRKQMEIQFAQMRESENNLKTQLAQKHVEIQELQNELQATCDNSTGEIDVMRQQMTIMQNQLMHTEGQLQHFKEAGDRLQDVARQLEESHRVHADMDHRLKSAHRVEQELQKQISSLQVDLDMAQVEAREASLLKADLKQVQLEVAALRAELATSINQTKEDSARIAMMITKMAEKDQELDKAIDEIAKLQSDLAKSTLEVEKLEVHLDAKTKEVGSLKIDLEKAAMSFNQVQEEINKKIIEIQQLKDNFDHKLEAEIEKASWKSQVDIMKLKEENNRLSAELQRSIGNPSFVRAPESICSEDTENGVENMLHDYNVELLLRASLISQKDEEIEALKTKLNEKDQLVGELNAQINTLERDVDNQSLLTQRLEYDLETQIAKNNELRVKNWKVMEAVSVAESRAETNLKKNLDEVTQQIKIGEQESTKALLQRIFPAIEVSENSYEKWISAFENKIRKFLLELNEQNTTSELSTDIEKQNKNLQHLVSHYKKIIDETEGMLNKLQSHVESEESRWQSQLHLKENEAANLRIELNELRNKLILEEKKTQEKIIQLENRLRDTESLNSELQAFKDANKSTLVDLTTREKLQEEKTRSSQTNQNQGGDEANLDASVIKLRSLAETSESSLKRDKNNVIQLQQEISQFKNEVGGCSSSEQSIINSPQATESPQSESQLEAQSLIAPLESTLLKNAEIDNCSITESMNLVQSQQEIDNSPLTTNLSSKSCDKTETDRQASCWNPLNAQQHKKNKKKRKGGSGRK